ncbi:GNAT family N-acetyltransferase [Ruminococcus champanellensis]|uniref:GNAT family N-acetyltransferase n=1 Tax=Ruminococcus champanellensis TaxID=1161942 RepID=UPI0023F3E69F|nr:GNAT family N-acetyltransferase [Ruminococcus champanellensis]
MEFTTYHSLPDAARQIREAVFVREQGFQLEFDKTDETAVHIVAWDGTQPAGTCRVYPAEGCFYIGRVAVLPQYRGTGLGRELMRRAEAYIRSTGGTAAELSGQVQASGFYKKLGYTPVGEVYPDEGCPHIRMQKKL